MEKSQQKTNENDSDECASLRLLWGLLIISGLEVYSKTYTCDGIVKI